MKLLFKKPDHISKSFFWFTWFTIISFIIGLAVKIVVAEYEARSLVDILDSKNKYGWNDDLKSGFYSDLSMLVLQVIIIIVTLVIYPMQIVEQIKLLKNKEHVFTKKAYKKMIKECIIFLVVFVLLDLISIIMLVMNSIKYDFDWDFDITFAVVSIFIPTPLIIGSMVWLKSLRKAGEVK